MVLPVYVRNSGALLVFNVSCGANPFTLVHSYEINKTEAPVSISTVTPVPAMLTVQTCGLTVFVLVVWYKPIAYVSSHKSLIGCDVSFFLTPG